MTFLPSQCWQGMTNSSIVYYLQAGCKSDTVNLFGNPSLPISKQAVAFTVVFLDIIGSLICYMLFSFLKRMQIVTAKEIDDAEVTATDFGVEIRGIPPHDNVREFKAALWEWIEKINEKAPVELNPETNAIDENQNNLMNLTFALSDYGKMNFMIRMADLFHEKKKYEKMIKIDKEKEAKLKPKIDEINMIGAKIN